MPHLRLLLALLPLAVIPCCVEHRVEPMEATMELVNTSEDIPALQIKQAGDSSWHSYSIEVTHFDYRQVRWTVEPFKSPEFTITAEKRDGKWRITDVSSSIPSGIHIVNEGS